MTTNSSTRSNHIPKIPLLGFYEAQCFAKYFTEIDLKLSKRLSLFSSNEEHITSVLCELLDKNGSQLHSLSYSLSDLNNDLAKNNGLLKADISISTSDYNRHQENKYTQSDLGIIINYQDYVDPQYNFRNGVLIQSKKLFTNNNSKYTFSSKYDSFDIEQHDRLKKLEEKLTDQECGKECIKYLMYNPSLKELPRYELQKILHKQKILHHENKIYRKLMYCYPNHFYKYFLTQEKFSLQEIIDIGCIFTSIKNVHDLAQTAAQSSTTNKPLFPFTLEALVNSIDVQDSSLSCFFIVDLMMRGIGCSCESFLKLVSHGKESTSSTDELEIPPPKYSIRLTISAGVQEDIFN